jgi:hypothetical protein
MPSARDIGSVVYVRYRDHVLFRNSDPETQEPIVQEVVGWLQAENDEYIRLVMARYLEPKADGSPVVKATGLVILKKMILEMRRIA